MRTAVSRPPGAERVVAPLELFFDLVYVFAIGQLSHHLLAHVDLRTGAETAISRACSCRSRSTTRSVIARGCL
jgi:low temperature requirement protein LtrA